MRNRCAAGLIAIAFVLAGFTTLSVPAAASHWCAPSSVTLSPASGPAGQSVLLSYRLQNGISDSLEVDDFYVTYSWSNTTSANLGTGTLAGYTSMTFTQTVVFPDTPGPASGLVEVRGYAYPDLASSLCTYGPIGIQIVGSTAPSVTATASPDRGNPPLTVHLNASAVGGTPPYSSYLWTPGDGSASILGQNVVHTYSVPGIYRAQVVVTDTAARTGSANVTVTVLGFLDANATASASQGPAPLRVSFASTVSGGTPPYRYHWDFGDGSSSSLSADNHTFSEPGQYNVTLTVLDAADRSATHTLQVSVLPGSAGPGLDASLVAWLVLGIALLVAMVALTVYLVNRRRPPSPPPPSP